MIGKNGKAINQLKIKVTLNDKTRREDLEASWWPLSHRIKQFYLFELAAGNTKVHSSVQFMILAVFDRRATLRLDNKHKQSLKRSDQTQHRKSSDWKRAVFLIRKELFSRKEVSQRTCSFNVILEIKACGARTAQFKLADFVALWYVLFIGPPLPFRPNKKGFCHKNQQNWGCKQFARRKISLLISVPV